LGFSTSSTCYILKGCVAVFIVSFLELDVPANLMVDEATISFVVTLLDISPHLFPCSLTPLMSTILKFIQLKTTEGMQTYIETANRSKRRELIGMP
jgi:hypothetical protein